MAAPHETDLLSAVKVLHSRGWALIPVPHRQKRPVITNWQHLRLTGDELSAAFRALSNVGVLLGEPSGWLIDIDLDSAEALLLADHFLPPTSACFGRTGTPEAHRLYRMSEPFSTTKFSDPLAHQGGDRGMLVEVRSTGTQTLVPPSVHPSGEEIVWASNGEPTEIDAVALQRSVTRLAAASLLARAWPGPGSRHDAAMALSGGLLRSGWSEEDATHFLRALVDATGDPEGNDRLAAVRSTSQALAEGKQTTGWTRLRNLIGLEVVAKVQAWLRTTPEPEAANVERPAVTSRPPRTQEPGQGTRIVELALDAGVVPFRDHEGEPYCLVPFKGRTETCHVRSDALRLHLSRIYYADAAKAPGAQHLGDARNMLEGDALFRGPVLPVAVRVALHQGVLYLDLGTDDWQVVRIGPNDWAVREADACPVRFRRPKGLSALPYPAAVGDVDLLRPLLNLQHPDDFTLIVGWLLAALYPLGPRPLLQVLGEQGSAKSSLAALLRSLVDPNQVPLRTVPKDERDLLIAAHNSAVLVYDNLSTLPRWLSNALCRLATGGGLSTRALYTNVDEALLSACRPVLLTGIGDVVTAADLLDRTLTVTLPAITPEERRTERDLDTAIAEARPAILTGVLEALVVGLQRIPTLQIRRPPRLADFALWVEACAPALSWPPGHFLSVLERSRRDADLIALESVPIGTAVLRLMEHHDQWEGTASDLLAHLSRQVSELVRSDRDWPRQPNQVSQQLRLLIPSLRQLGIEVHRERVAGTGLRRIVLAHLKAVPTATDGKRTGAEQLGTGSGPTSSGCSENVSEDEACALCSTLLDPGDHYRCTSCTEAEVRRNEALFKKDGAR